MDAAARGATTLGGETRFARLWSEFRESPVAVAALGVVLVLIVLAVLAPWIAPQDPYDLAQLSILDNMLHTGVRGSILSLVRTDDLGRGLISVTLSALVIIIFVY